MDTIGGGCAFSSAQVSEEISQVIVHDCLKSTCLPLSPNSMLGCYAGLLEAFLGGRLTGRHFASRHYYKSFNIEIGGEGARAPTAVLHFSVISDRTWGDLFSPAKFLPTTVWISTTSHLDCKNNLGRCLSLVSQTNAKHGKCRGLFLWAFLRPLWRVILESCGAGMKMTGLRAFNKHLFL